MTGMEKDMGFDKIREVVLAEAKAEADHILEGAKRAAEEQLGAARARIDAEAERSFQARVRAIDDELNRTLIQFKGSAGKQVLARQGEILRAVFDAARGEILSWPAREYAEFMERLLRKSAGNMGGMLRIHPDDAAVFERVLSSFNRDRNRHELVVVDDTDPLPERGGFVLVTKEFEIDRTLATLLLDLEHEMLPDIAGDLFA